MTGSAFKAMDVVVACLSYEKGGGLEEGGLKIGPNPKKYTKSAKYIYIYTFYIYIYIYMYISADLFQSESVLDYIVIHPYLPILQTPISH